MPENLPSHYHALVLRACRNACGITRQQLADISGVSVPAIARIELSEAKPRRATWRVLLWTFEQVGIVVDEDQSPQVVIRIDTSVLSHWQDHGGVQSAFSDKDGGGRS